MMPLLKSSVSVCMNTPETQMYCIYYIFYLCTIVVSLNMIWSKSELYIWLSASLFFRTASRNCRKLGSCSRSCLKGEPRFMKCMKRDLYSSSFILKTLTDSSLFCFRGRVFMECTNEKAANRTQSVLETRSVLRMCETYVTSSTRQLLRQLRKFKNG